MFSVLAHFWACNPGKPWWRKRELLTDLCYWFIIPLFARYVRIGLLVIGAGVIGLELGSVYARLGSKVAWIPWSMRRAVEPGKNFLPSRSIDLLQPRKPNR